MSSTRKRLTIALGGAVALGLTVASAATLGGLNSKSLGASDTIVSSCDENGVAIDYENSYDKVSGKYVTTAVNFSGVNSLCDGKTLNVTLKDGNATALASATTTVALTNGSQRVAVPAVNAEAIGGAAVVITG
jgi:hypothetical protein